MALETGCVIDAKIWMSQRKIIKNCNRAGKKKHLFHHENIA